MSEESWDVWIDRKEKRVVVDNYGAPLIDAECVAINIEDFHEAYKLAEKKAKELRFKVEVMDAFLDAYEGDYEEEEIVCPEGFTWDEWCDPEFRLGIEHCEFSCPFGRLDHVYEEIKKTRKVIRELKKEREQKR